jgi:excisionase family DNA binding protein
MGTHKTPGTKKRASETAHANKQPDMEPQWPRTRQSPTEPPTVAPLTPDFMKERTLTVKEVAYRLGMSTSSVRLWLQNGRLRGWQVGGRYCKVLVSEASVEEMLITGTRRFGS